MTNRIFTGLMLIIVAALSWRGSLADDMLAADGRPEAPRARQQPAESQPVTDWRFWEWSCATDGWFGARAWLENRGVNFQASVTMDWASNFAGGVNQEGSNFHTLFDANLTFDSERLGLHKGGTLFFNLQNITGESICEDVGAFQGICNNDVPGDSSRFQIAELWYQQAFWGQKLLVKVGKIDANADFAAPDNAVDFLNGSASASPTILFMPTYPDPACGVELRVEPTNWFFAGFGMFDGAAQAGIKTGENGPKTFFNPPHDFFYIGEIGGQWELGQRKLPGKLRLGAWHHSATFNRFDGDTASGTAGPYLVFDQLVWRHQPAGASPDMQNSTRGVGMFMQYGWADPAIADVDHHLSAGVRWIGPCTARQDDMLGVGVTWVRFSRDPAAGFVDGSETAMEIFYKLQLTPWLSVKPDLQWIINPGGMGAKDAVVGGLRVEIVF